MTDPEPQGPPEGGDPACWLDQVCPECGAVIEGDHDCPRAPSRDAADGDVQFRV